VARNGLPRLRGHVAAIDRHTRGQRDEMFALFSQYYDCIERARFDSDLDEKDAVILLTAGGAIQGFSTLKTLPVRVGRRTHYGVYSGDTVLAREYWGQRVLGKVFLRYLFKQKMRRPLRPFWWFLISKGYKTYLLMANNFGEHWPRHEQAMPAERKTILDAFGTAYFPDYYDAATGLIQFPESLGQLKFHITPITDEQREVPRISFFEEKNPTWMQGTELACLARMTWSMPLYYSLKAIWKLSGGRLGLRGAKVRPALPGGGG
jgi:hypothetical protein